MDQDTSADGCEALRHVWENNRVCEDHAKVDLRGTETDFREKLAAQGAVFETPVRPTHHPKL